MNVVNHPPRFLDRRRFLEQLADRECWTRQTIDGHQLARINELWNHARNTVPYYRRLARQHGLPLEFASLDAYRALMPVLQPQAVRARPVEFLSHWPERGFWTRTSGAAGIPLKCYWGRGAHRGMLRTRRRFYDSWGVDLSDRTVCVWGGGRSFAPGSCDGGGNGLEPLEGRRVGRLRLSAHRVDRPSLRNHLIRIREFKPTILYGYSSALHLLALEAEATGFECDSLRLVTLSGQSTHREHAEAIERVFRAPCAVEYGSIECGIIASEWPDQTLRVREDVVMLETEPRSDGCFDILITVLNNPSFPLFRYAIGDVTTECVRREPVGFARLTPIVGRRDDSSPQPSGHRRCPPAPDQATNNPDHEPSAVDGEAGDAHEATIPKWRKAARLRELLRSPKQTYLLEAHNGLSARVAQEAGFDAIWATTSSVAASMGLRDANEIGWAPMIGLLEFMSEATSIPILVHAQTGQGVFHDVRRLVRDLEQCRLAGLCIDDACSCSAGSTTSDIERLYDRVREAKEAQRCEDFVIVARCDVSNVDWDVGEAILRAEACHRAGADAVLVQADEMGRSLAVAFQQEWSGRCPVVVIAARASHRSMDALRRHPFSAVICADHLLQTSLASLRLAAHQIQHALTPVQDPPVIIPHAGLFDTETEASGLAELPLGLGAFVHPVPLVSARSDRVLFTETRS